MTIDYKLLAQKRIGPIGVAGNGYGYGYGYGSGGGTVSPEYAFDTSEVPGFSAVPAISYGYGIEVNCAKQLSDGNILYGMSGSAQVQGTSVQGIFKTDASGRLITTFTPQSLAGGSVSVIREQADGRILIAGSFSFTYTNLAGSSATMRNICRLNADGTLDKTFTSPLTSTSYTANDVIIEPSGDILICGYLASGAVSNASYVGVIRLNEAGTPIAGSTAAIIGSQVSNEAYTHLRAMYLEDSGKVLVQSVDGDLIRLESTLTSKDSSFLPNISTINLGTLPYQGQPNSAVWSTWNPNVTGIVKDTEGNIRLSIFPWSGAANMTGPMTLGLLPSGAIDSAFQKIYSTGIQHGATSIAITDDNKIAIVGGFSSGDTNDEAGTLNAINDKLAILNADGTPDESFKSLTTNYYSATGLNYPTYIGNLNDGSLIICGTSQTASVSGTYYAVAKIVKYVDTAPYELVYTCGVNPVLVDRIFIANHNDFINGIDIAVVPSTDSTISKKHHAVYDLFIDSNDYSEKSLKISLSQGDKIYAYSTVNEPMSINVFGAEIS